MKPIVPGQVRRILIRANNWIGDVVMISPAVRAIREHFDRASIAILAKDWVLETLRGNPFYDDLIEYDSDGRHRGAGGLLRLAYELRRARFDMAILFQKAFEAAALARMAGIRLRVGYATDFRRFLLTHPLPVPSPGTHHVAAFLGIPRFLGCPVPDPYPFFHVDPDSRRRAHDWLLAAEIPARAPLVALHPGASKPPRAWHAERFALLGRGLAEKAGARVVLLGGPSDRELVQAIAADLPAGSLLPVRLDLSIRDMAGVLECCHLFVGNDSGPMHLAAALGVPVAGIFGPGSPGRTSPIARDGRVEVIGRGYPCSPCRQDFFRECAPAPSGKPFCLEEIAVEEVLAVALRLLGGAVT
jgi:lipopolysaccharide heptosyltransferase II